MDVTIKIKEEAKAKKKRVVLPEGTEIGGFIWNSEAPLASTK